VFLRDIANIRMDVQGVEFLDLRTLGSADSVTINDMTGTGFRQANIDLSASGAGGAGDGAADVVHAEVWAMSFAPTSSITASAVLMPSITFLSCSICCRTSLLR
jgi:hypothetical protein